MYYPIYIQKKSIKSFLDIMLFSLYNSILSFILGINFQPIYFYSVLNAITGSFLDAALAGIIPPINVSIILNIINITAFVAFYLFLCINYFIYTFSSFSEVSFFNKSLISSSSKTSSLFLGFSTTTSSFLFLFFIFSNVLITVNIHIAMIKKSIIV